VPSSIPCVTAPPPSPDAEQQRVLDHRGGALLVTGGAGAGKSWVLRERFARLIEGGADPERVALVVGSVGGRDAARTALLGRLPASLPGLQVVTVHGLANRILHERHAVLGYDEPPRILSAAEQFARVRELLANEDPADWPAYGRLLQLRGFVDEVRQFLVRAQEEMRTPESIAEAADRRGLMGWHELARFFGAYQSVMDDLNIVDFGAVLHRAAVAAGQGDPLFDHVIVDDYQDTTLAAEAILKGLGLSDLVVAADASAHVFSFQGMSRQPLDRFTDTFRGAAVVMLSIRHRAPTPPDVEAWVAPHTSEEHAAAARELRRLHVEEGVEWSAMAVVVRRQGAHLGGLLRALDDARIPRAVPERGLSLTAEPATRPYVLALRWLVADATRREGLVEQLLTSDVVGLSPAAARGLVRVARTHTGSVANALDMDEGLTPQETETVRSAREALAKASLFAEMSVQDAFKRLWEDLPCSRRLVERSVRSGDARRELDTVVTFANLVAETDGDADKSVEAFLESLDAGEHGPGHSAWERARPDAVRVLTAHGAMGHEFDAVVVAGVTEGNFPSLSRSEPMFDLAVLDRPITNAERNRDRLQDERRLFDAVIERARHHVVLICADGHPDTDELSVRSRFVSERDIAWAPAPTGPFEEPVSVREAAASWRHDLARVDLPSWRRLAALEGLTVLGVDPGRWWFQRGWTDTGRALHEQIRVSYSRLSNLESCELMHVLGDELGLGRPGGYHAWVGKTVHRIIEEAERGTISSEPPALVVELERRWRPQEFPSTAVSDAFRELAKMHMLRNWHETYAGTPPLGIEQFFEFEFEGATVIGYIDRIGPSLKDGTVITDFKTGKSDNAGKPEDSLQLGIYYLAVQEAESLADFKPVRQVELAFLRGNWKTPNIDFRKMPINERDEERYQRVMRERLGALIHRKEQLNRDEVYRPNPYANCRFCDFKTLCPLFPEGQPVFSAVVPVASLRRAPEVTPA
jgi:superfamily I DNA/RNA helicase/RecB family exonuclease